MLDYTFKALDGRFPRKLTPDHQRKTSPFGKTWSEVLNLLEKELSALGYRRGSAILQTGHGVWDVRQDGRLRSDARKPEHPGVVVRFDVWNSDQRRYQPMSFECDQFADWKANVRAIADAMEALRKVDRYAVTGGGKSNAHYEGYKALGSGADSLQEAAEFIAKHCEFPPHSLGDKETLGKAYKQAAARLHPDRPKGSHELFLKLQNAKQLLDAV